MELQCAIYQGGTQQHGEPLPCCHLAEFFTYGEEFGTESSASTWLTALLLQEQKGNLHNSLSCSSGDLGAFPHHPATRFQSCSFLSNRVNLPSLKKQTEHQGSCRREQSAWSHHVKQPLSRQLIPLLKSHQIELKNNHLIPCKAWHRG